jgi:hypothetical protein
MLIYDVPTLTGEGFLDSLTMGLKYTYSLEARAIELLCYSHISPLPLGWAKGPNSYRTASEMTAR